MKKRIAFIGALISLMPSTHTLLIGTGVALTSAAVTISMPEKAQAETARFYEKRADKKFYDEDYYGAIADYLKAIEVNTDFEDTYYAFARIGRSQYYLKDYKNSIKSLTKSIQIRPRYKYAYDLRGDAKLDSGDYYGAISDYNKAIDIKSDDSYSYYFRANAKRRIGDMKGACADWRKASSLGYEDAAQWVRNDC